MGLVGEEGGDHAGHEEEGGAVVGVLDEEVAEEGGGLAELALLEAGEGALVGAAEGLPVGVRGDRQFVQADGLFDIVDAELAEAPGFEDFTAPFDKEDANLLCTLHNKLVNTQNEDLVHWWKIFHLAGEDWTLPRENWEGVNWSLFSGDDESMKLFVGRIVEHMEKFRIKNLMYPE